MREADDDVVARQRARACVAAACGRVCTCKSSSTECTVIERNLSEISRKILAQLSLKRKNHSTETAVLQMYKRKARENLDVLLQVIVIVVQL